MSRRIYVNVSDIYTKIAIVEDGKVREIHIESPHRKRMMGNIYLGSVTKVLPGMQAAFVDIGLAKDAFLYVHDILIYPDEQQDTEEDNDGELGKMRAPLPSPVTTPIEQLIQVGQLRLVQITREPMEMKGARISTHITLPGRFLVLMPTVSNIGISKRIDSSEERDRLKAIAENIAPEDMGLIVRTVSEGQAEEDLREDVASLFQVWEKLKKNMANASPPTRLYQDIDPIARVLRDSFDQSIGKVFIDSEFEYRRCREFVATFAPQLIDRIVQYTDTTPIFDKFGIATDMDKALHRKVWLPSGGHIIIDQTEALAAIDVNTGRFVGSSNLEETVFKTNLEAAETIGHQVRLRNVGGIIVIDFIDMEKQEHRDKVLECLREAFASDRAKIQISHFSEMGLVEMTRKRLKRSLHRVLFQSCPECHGTGLIKNPQTVAAEILFELHRLLVKPNIKRIQIKIHPSLERLLHEPIHRMNTDNRNDSKTFLMVLDPNISINRYEISQL